MRSMSWICKNISKKLPNGVYSKPVKFGGKWICPKDGSPPLEVRQNMNFYRFLHIFSIFHRVELTNHIFFLEIIIWLLSSFNSRPKSSL